MSEVKTRGLAAFVAAADQSDNEGYLATLSGGKVTVAAAADANVVGVITEGGEADENTDVALLGAFDGTCHFKAGGAITQGSRLMLMADGTVDCSGTGLCVGIALEDAVTDELFEAAPRTPVTIA